MLLMIAACMSGSDGTEAAAPTQDAPAPRGGTLRVAVPDDIVAFQWDIDPQRAYTFPASGLGRCCLFRTLFSYNGRPTEEGGTELHPDLADGPAEVTPDGLTWTFRLRPGIRFAPPFEDITITSLDLVRALERTARVNSPGTYGFYYEVIRGFDDYATGEADSIVGLETPDERTLVVRLDDVTGDLAYRFSLPATSPIPDGAADGHDRDYLRFLVASGPYMIEGSEALDPSVPPGEREPLSGYVPPTLDRDGAVVTPGSLVLVRNPSWDPTSDRLRPAYVDRIEIAIGGGERDEIASLVDAGELDLQYVNASPVEQVTRYEEDPELVDRVYRNADDILFGVTMNVALPPFDDVHVRRAVGLAIDEATLVSLLAEPPYGPYGGGGAEVETHLAPDGLEARLLRTFDPYPFDPAAARAEMAASAYDRTGDGRCDVSACRNLTAVVLDQGVIPEQAQAIREALADLGIELTVEIHRDTPFYGAISDPSNRVPIGIAYAWGADYPEGGGWFQGLFHSSGLETTNSSLLGARPAQLREWGYDVTTVPSVDDRIALCLHRRGVARTQCWAELDQYLMREVVPWVPYMITESATVVSERVVAYSFDQFSVQPALDRIALAPGSE
jgi:peptide/nickel transport system substrate-binding protein